MKIHGNVERMRGNKNAQSGEQPADSAINIRTSFEKREAYRNLANQRGISLTALILSLLDAELSREEKKQ